MANLTSTLTVRLRDAVSGPARAASGAIRGIRSSISAVNTAGRNVRGFMVAHTRAIDDFRLRLLDAVAAVYVLNRALGAPIRAGMDFETILEDIRQKADLSQDSLGRVGERLREIGKQYNQTARDVGKGADFLIGMGLGGKTAEEDVKNTLGMMPSVTKTSTAYRVPMDDASALAHAMFLHMGIAPEDMERAFGIAAKGGKEGGFELQNMARYFPSILAYAKFAGSKGFEGLADITAALQIARTGAGTPEAAARATENFFQKLTLKETIKNFDKFGIDILAEYKRARKLGISPIEHVLGILKEITKGDSDLISQIFGDKQVLEFLRPMWDQIERYRQLRTDALKAEGEVDRDFESRLKTAAEKAKAFQVALEDFWITVGNKIMPTFTTFLEELTGLFDTLDSRVGVFDKIGSAFTGFMQGLGFKDVNDFRSGLREIFNLLFGRTENFEEDSKRLASIGDSFRSFGKAIADLGSDIRGVIQPITDFLGIDWGSFVEWAIMFGAASIGITMLAKAIRGLASAFLLLTGIKTVWAIFKGAGALAAGAAGGAAAGGAAAGGAAGGAAAGAATKGFWGKLLRFGGGAGFLLLLKEFVDAVDPDSNFFGLLSDLKEDLKRNGIDPDQKAPLPGTEADDAAERQSRLDEISARLKQIEAGTHPSMRDAPNPERDRLMLERNLIEGQATQGASAGSELMAGYGDAIRRGFAELNAMVDAEMSKLKAKMSTSAGITITPRVDGSVLRGVHADTGVE